MTALLRLPPEILEYVLDNLPSADLRSCSATCTALEPLARARTLRTLTISDASQLMRALWFSRNARDLLVQTRSLTILDGQLTLASMSESRLSSKERALREVRAGTVPPLHDRDDVQHALDELFASPLPRLCALRCLWRYYESWPFTDSFLFPNGTLGIPGLVSITHLSIQSSFPTVTELYRALESFPHLTHLNVEDCTFRDGIGEAPTHLYGRLPLVELRNFRNESRDDWWNFEYPVFYELALLATPGSLRSIACEIPVTADWDVFLRGPHGRSLRTAELSVGPQDFAPVLEHLGRYCQELEALTFVVDNQWSSTEIPTSLHPLLDCLQSAALARLHSFCLRFEAPWQSDGDIPPCPVHLIARMLRRAPLERLVSFTVEANGGASLPSLNADLPNVIHLSCSMVSKYTEHIIQKMDRDEYNVVSSDGDDNLDVKFYIDWSRSSRDGPKLKGCMSWNFRCT